MAEACTYLLNTVLVALLQSQDLVCALLGIIDLLPCLLLLLLKQGDSIRQELGVPLDTTMPQFDCYNSIVKKTASSDLILTLSCGV